MKNKLLLALLLLFSGSLLQAQDTKFRGFVHFNTLYKKDKASFEIGEQDFFLTSEISEKFSFLGESVIKFSSGSFKASIERIVIKYNIAGNHNLLVGKHHTPLNYWNDTYHHGRVFFPTIDRPAFFDAKIFPIHTTGISLQGQNLGDIRFGYDFMIGNGVGAHDEPIDDDVFKSISVAVHIKPVDGMRAGVSLYVDKFAEGIHRPTGAHLSETVNHTTFTGSFAYFGGKFEFLSEATFTNNKADLAGTAASSSFYAYSGVRFKNVVPYVRFDKLTFDAKEMYYDGNSRQAFVAGLRYEHNYLSSIKLEYQFTDSDAAGSESGLKAQIALGF